MKQFIINKFTSRKFWTCVSMIVSGLIMMFGVAETSAETIAGAITACGGAIGYMIAEGIIDAKNAGVVVENVGTIIDEIIPDEEVGVDAEDNH